MQNCVRLQLLAAFLQKYGATLNIMRAINHFFTKCCTYCWSVKIPDARFYNLAKKSSCGHELLCLVLALIWVAKKGEPNLLDDLRTGSELIKYLVPK